MSAGRRWLLGSGAAAATATVLWAFFLPAGPSPKPYAEFAHPEGRYTVVVVATPGWRSYLPGQGSDSPGVVMLFDERTALLRSAEITMVQQIDRVDWEKTRVMVPTVGEWALPR